MSKKSENKISKMCDRCNTTLIREWGFKDYLLINTDGWQTIQGKLLCPQCFSRGLIIFEKFMRKEL